jgi:hypothetical protein
MQWLHARLRGLFWWWALLLATSILLGWIIGDWHSAWRIIQTIVLAVIVLVFLALIVAGFVELWQRRKQEP